MDELHALAEKLLDIQAKAKQLGIFVEDRDLLECRHCQLIEDVACDDRLFTYYKTGKDHKDTGLRFIELNQSEPVFQCPSCGKEIRVQQEKE